ncbi:MAG: DNA adenine methylase [Calditrichaeota bacterium]|nr:MAG: DNA adenine methylase [Calditrichota bacterium]MBL1207668.1 DNA adenine methylase [Calditrichota bacterium]NOG47501.1 DNA adenine methylase [Calditrichota bacterium]
MRQLHLFEKEIVHKAPNVASVPQYSPLRYPGGKTWLYPFAKQWLHDKKEKFLIEPFAGGASVGLAAAIEGWVDHVILVDLDDNIFSFWDALINGYGDWLADQVLDFDFTEKNINDTLNKKKMDAKEKAFALLLNNRISHGGIMAIGAGRIKNGENGKGLSSRWYPQTLNHRIKKICKVADRISIVKDDAFEFTKNFLSNDKAIFFFDPPYTKAGKRLYQHFQIDHEKLFKVSKKLKGDFLITYDFSEEILSYAKKYDLFYEKVLMQTTHLIKKHELLISKDSGWL